jgi:uncharacterized membrane protein YbhN (UPF0104 family)
VAANAAAGAVVDVALLLVAAGLLVHEGVGRVRLPDAWPALVGTVAALAGVGGVTFASPAGRRLLRPLQRPLTRFLEAVRAPSHAAPLLLGSAGVTGAHILTVAASLRAFTGHVPLLPVAAADLAATAAAAVSPTPGGLGAVEVALTAGLNLAGSRSPRRSPVS